MKWREADQITQFIMTDSWHNINGQYDYSKDGLNVVIEFDVASKMVHVYAREVYSRPWLGCKDNLTNKFRDWLHKIVNQELERNSSGSKPAE